MSKIWFSTLEMLSLPYIMHASCPILVLWMILQKSTMKAIPMPFHSWFISLIPYSSYITSICMGHWCWWSMMSWSHVRKGPYIFLIPQIISTKMFMFQIYFDQLKSMSMWVTNQNTLWWGHVLWLWGHGFWWGGHKFYDGAIQC